MKKSRNIFISFIITLALVLNIGYSKSLNSIDSLYSIINPITVLIIFYGVHSIINKYKNNIKEKNSIILLSIIISIFQIISINYNLYDTLIYSYKGSFQFIKSMIIVIGNSFLYYYIITIILQLVHKIKYKKTYHKLLINLFEKHPVRNAFIIILITYIIGFIIFIPGNTTADYHDEIHQYNHLYSFSTKYINPINEHQYINGHHSAFHTYITGSINRIGIKILNQNLGLFLNALLQIILFALVLSYTFKIYKELKVNYILRIIILLLYLILPLFVINSFTVYKDAPLIILLVLYSCILIEICYLKKRDIKTIIKLILTSLLIIMIAKKGLYLVILSYISLILLFIKNNKIITITLILLLLFGISYEKILMVTFDITPGSSREILTIPIQQIARTIKNHDNELSKHNKKIINNIIDYDNTLKSYNPKSSDSVKNAYFNKNYTKKEMKDFLILYLKLFFKYPKTYISAFLNTTSGYTDINHTTTMAYWNINDRYITKDLTDYTKPRFINKIDQNIEKTYKVLSRTPLISLLFSMGFYFWSAIIMVIFSINKKELKKSIPFLPLITALLLLFVSPVNYNPRYMMPVASLVIVIFPYFIKLYNEKVKK